MSIKILLVSSLLLMAALRDQAQQSSPSQSDFGVKNIFPTSPEAAALGRFGDIPVSNYTGTADISIPLYTITEDGIDIPITLRYQSSGIRVSDEATDVGLGWMLEPGGAIIQVVNGYADGSGADNAYLDPTDYSMLKSGSIEGALTMGVTDGFAAPGGTAYNGNIGISNVLNNVVGGAFQPDIYQFSFPGGYSGKFYINPLTQQIEQLDKNSQITFQKYNDGNGNKGWEAITLKGTQYYFTTAEQSSNGNPTYLSYTWKLSKIIFTNHGEIDFSYKPSTWIYYSVSQSRQTGYMFPAYFPSDGGQITTTPTQVETLAYTISQIVTPDLVINFNIADRTDIPSNADSVMSKINSIDIMSRFSNKKIKSFVFNYDYFTGSSVGSDENYLGTAAQNQTRLKLESVQEIGYNASGDSVYNPPYQFYYNEKQQLPTKSSDACDYWGYYNGFAGSLFPDLEYFYYTDATVGDTTSMTASEELNGAPASSATYSLLESTAQYFPSGAAGYGGGRGSRMVDTSMVGTGMLNEIIYPTKGYTVFNYESNSFTGYDYLDKSKYDSLWKTYTALDVNSGNTQSTPAFEVNRAKPISFTLNFSGGKSHVSIDSLDYSSVSLVQINKTSGATTVLTSWGLSINDAASYDSLGYVTLSAGYNFPGDTTVKYALVASLPDNFGTPTSNHNPSVSATFSYYDLPPIQPSSDMISYGGGIRIASIKNYDNTGKFLTGKLYKYIGDNGKTSGLLMSPLQFYIVRPIFAEYCSTTTISDVDCQSGANDVWWFSSQSQVPFSSAAQGNLVGYSRVEIDQIDSTGTGNNGKEVYYYHNAPSQALLTAPPIGDALNGTLQKEDVYDKNGNKLTETSSSYSLLSFSTFMGVKGFYNIIYNNGIYESPDFSYWLIYYPLNMFWYNLSKKTTTEYAGLDSIVTNELYTYNSLGQMVRTDITNSKGNTESALYTYPSDTSGTNASLCGFNGLYENLLFQRNLVNNNEVSKTAIDYTQASSGEIVKADVMQSYNGQPFFQSISFDNYGPFAHLQQYTEKGLTTSILWGYNNQYPIAKIAGSNFNTVKAQVDTAILNTGPETQIEAQLNNLRAAFKVNSNVQVTTYTCAPLIGIASQTDPKGYTTYYEYDNFGRLKDVKDKDGNVLKKYDYHYQGQ